MKISLNFVFYFLVIALFFHSCSESESIEDMIVVQSVDSKVTINNPIDINLLDSTAITLNFEIFSLDGGAYASRVHPNGRVQILDNSTYGYSDALSIDDPINEEHNWSLSNNFVLGTSVGNAGQFEGQGLKYLGFRILNNGKYQYGWIALANKEGNTCVEIESYAVNITNGKSISAGQVE